jgi:hypothetical protein
MVSLPAIKSLMLQAFRLIKGASVADRIDICGVPPLFCLVARPRTQTRRGLETKTKDHLVVVVEFVNDCRIIGRRTYYVAATAARRTR